MSGSRRKRRAAERQLAGEGKSRVISPWAVLIIGLVALAVGLARSCA